MNRLQTANAIDYTVNWAVSGAVDRAVSGAVNWAVGGAVGEIREGIRK